MEPNTQNAVNPQSFQAPTATGGGLFRAQGDYGTTIYNTNGQALNLIGNDSGLFNSDAERASYGNAGGQATEALNRIKNKYGVDFNNLPTINLGDYISQKNQGWNGGPSGFSFNSAGVNADSFFGNTKNNATFGSTTLNGQPQQAPLSNTQVAQQMQQNPQAFQSNNQQYQPSYAYGAVNGTQPQSYSSGVTQSQSNPSSAFPTTSLQPGAQGDQVKQLQDYLVSQGLMTQDQVNTGYGIYGPQTTAAVAALQQRLGVDNSTGVGYFGPRTLQALMGQNPQNMTTPSGTVVNAPMNINTSSSYPSSIFGSDASIAGALNTRQSYEDTINNYLQQQAQARVQLNNAKLYELQQQASIRNGDSVAPLQGQDLAELEKQMAFRTLPAEIALNNAQTALALYKQSPEYQSEQQARDTAFNLLQTYPDIGVQYDTSKSAQQNLQAIQSALPTSQKYQASLMVLSTNPLTGQPTLLKKGSSGGGSTGSSGGVSSGVSGGQTVSIPTEIQPAIQSVVGKQYIDMGKLNTAQIPSAQRISAATGIPLLSKEDANAVQTAFASFSSADALINQVKKLSGDVLTAPNDVSSQAKQFARLNTISLAPFLSTDNSAKQFISARNSLLSLITRASGEKGVLTDADVKRISDALPSFGDNKDLAAQKAANMSDVINSVLQGAVTAYIGSATGNKQTASPVASGTTKSGLSYTVTN